MRGVLRNDPKGHPDLLKGPRPCRAKGEGWDPGQREQTWSRAKVASSSCFLILDCNSP